MTISRANGIVKVIFLHGLLSSAVRPCIFFKIKKKTSWEVASEKEISNLTADRRPSARSYYFAGN